MILGNGIDIVDIKRIDNTYKKFGVHFLKKILTEQEVKEIQDNSNDKIVLILAKHWAVKEAVSKAVSCGLINGSPLHFKDIILGFSARKMPIIKPTENLLNIISTIYKLNKDEVQKINFHISTSGDAGIYIANAILTLDTTTR